MDAKLVALIVTGGIAIACALYGYIMEANRPMPQRPDHSNPPPAPSNRSASPTSYPRRRRRRSRSSLPERSVERATSPIAQLSENCLKCEKKPFVEVYPCKHSSTCKDCFDHHIKSSNKCPVCNEVIVGCSPKLSTWGKCKKCDKFSKLVLVKPCNHSVICTNCFDQHLKSCGNCPACRRPIESCDPVSDTRGKCNVCDEFRLLVKFVPCGHASLCEQHAEMYVDMNGKKCIDCGQIVTQIL